MRFKKGDAFHVVYGDGDHRNVWVGDDLADILNAAVRWGRPHRRLWRFIRKETQS